MGGASAGSAAQLWGSGRRRRWHCSNVSDRMYPGGGLWFMAGERERERERDGRGS